MNLDKLHKKLYSETFIIGALRRKSAMKSLAEISDPQAAELLVRAVDESYPAAASIPKILLASAYQPWVDRMWRLWAEKRQVWLGNLLIKKGAPSKAGGQEKNLSHLKLGYPQLPSDRDTAHNLMNFFHDKDQQVKKACQGYFERLHQQEPKLWLETMLLGGEYSHLGFDRPAAADVLPYLSSKDEKIKQAAQSYYKKAPLEIKIYAELAGNQGATLPLVEETAREVVSFLKDEDASVAKAAEAYALRVQEEKPSFWLRFMMKARRVDMVSATRQTVPAGLDLLADDDTDVRVGAESFITGLPNEQTWNDLVVDQWIRTDSSFLQGIIKEQKRLPSNPAKEALLFLVTGQVQSYHDLKDEDGALLIEAFAMASSAMKKRINTVVLESKDSRLTDAYRQATATVSRQDLDPALAVQALIAAGNEDGLVEATRTMDMAALLEMCKRWMESGRRPQDERKKEVVEKALQAYQKIHSIKIKPARNLPPGVRDIFEVWRTEKLTDKQIRNDLEAEDPFVRARGLFLGSQRGLVDQAALRQKASSTDWPERFIVALSCPDMQFKKDHVHWVSLVGGADAELMATRVDCNLDEYEKYEAMRADLKKGTGILAERSLALLDVLQTFRGLFIGGEIVVTDDDSAPVKEAIKVGDEEVRQDDLSF